ncbi:arginine N-succinyltransferase [Shewanella sp. A32]|uniref:arginine N-succinyltransferase n=1 Tax=Shewanella sp. A32 TaxID=3031327 RepID=UPI0023B95DAA|nr:arginine N-succinyltransferase [Shewanella sp. A32]MDF0533468.1 arginine N-succinyltransferase [Shewanella sp. A32]
MTHSISASQKQKGFTGTQVLLMMLAAVVITAGVSFLVIRTYIFPQPFSPVTLNDKETQKLDKKLQQLGWQSDSGARRQASSANDLTPEPYRESDANRQVTLSEKEVNSIIARSPDFAQRVAIDFSDNLASAKILIPIPRDFPIMAGEILRVNAGLDIHLDKNRRPVVALVGVSLMGVPIPNAWLGNMKNVNLVSEFGDRGFWNTFADGVDDIQIHDGELYIKLRK